MARRSIFQRVRLVPGQAREVAEQRLADAERLIASGLSRHANGAMYLAGLAVECLLKAALLEKRPELGFIDRTGLAERDRPLWDLVHRRHHLDALLQALPEVRARVQAADDAGRGGLGSALSKVCSNWSVFARYSPVRATLAEATLFVGQVRELKPWLGKQ